MLKIIAATLLLSSVTAYAGDKDLPDFPRKRPRSGEHNLNCTDSFGGQQGNCVATARGIAQFFKTWSRGSFVLKAQKGGPSKYYFKKCGANVVHCLAQLTGWVARHEFGHQLGLGQGAWYHTDGEGHMKIHHMGDNEDTQGGGDAINAATLYHLGNSWLPIEEIEVYKPEKKVYELERLDDFKSGGVKAIFIPFKYRQPIKGYCVPPKKIAATTVDNDSDVGDTSDNVDEELGRSLFIHMSTKAFCNKGHYGKCRKKPNGKWDCNNPVPSGNRCLSINMSSYQSGDALKIKERIMPDNKNGEWYDEWFTGVHVKIVPDGKDDGKTLKFTVDFDKNPNPVRKPTDKLYPCQMK